MTVSKLTPGPWLTASLRRLRPLTLLAMMSLLVSVVSYVFGLRPAEQRLAAAEHAYHGAKQMQADLQRTRTQQVQARTALRQLEIERQVFPTQAAFTSLAVALSDLAKRERVIIPGMGYDIKKPDGLHPVKATIAFRAVGEYAAIYRFLHRLETAEPYLVIESLDVTSERKEDRSMTRVLVNITVATYLRQAA